MNNIIINNKDIVLDNDIFKISINISEANLTIKGKVCIYDYNTNDTLKLNIKVLENSSLEYYMFSNNKFNSKEINIDNYNNSKTLFNYSFIGESISKVIINNNILENDIISDINIRGVSFKDASIVIDSNGYVKKNTLNNVFNEDLRGLNLDEGFIKINPNMYIDSNDVVANHNSTIGNIDDNYLFYLNSKGINNEEATKLIINGFINSILNDKIKNIINY